MIHRESFIWQWSLYSVSVSIIWLFFYLLGHLCVWFGGCCVHKGYYLVQVRILMVIQAWLCFVDYLCIWAFVIFCFSFSAKKWNDECCDIGDVVTDFELLCMRHLNWWVYTLVLLCIWLTKLIHGGMNTVFDILSGCFEVIFVICIYWLNASRLWIHSAVVDWVQIIFTLVILLW